MPGELSHTHRPSCQPHESVARPAFPSVAHAWVCVGVLWCELVAVLAMGCHPIPSKDIPPLGYHIGNVIHLASKEEVVGIAASRHIALVENAHSVWYFTITQNPRDPMGVVLAEGLYESMPIFVTPPNPPPASASGMLRNEREELLLRSDRDSHVSLQNTRHPRCCPTPRAKRAARLRGGERFSW